MSISISADAPISHTVSFEPYGLGTAILTIKVGGTREIFRRRSSIDFSTTTVTFNIDADDLGAGAYDCGSCGWASDATYSVVLSPDGVINNKPYEIVESGAVTFTGPVPCSSCGGEDPPPGEDPPGGGGTGGGPGDDPYGGGTDDPQVSPPSPPSGDLCLPPAFIAPNPPVPTPCSEGGAEGGTAGFS